jgi:hypothetical protein
MGKDFVPCEGAELSMRLNARVHARDEGPVGFVHWVIVDRPNLDIAGLVIAEPGLLARQVLVPAAEVEAATREGETLRLRITRHELEALPDHTPDDLCHQPSRGWMPFGWAAARALTSAPGVTRRKFALQSSTAMW